MAADCNSHKKVITQLSKNNASTAITKLTKSPSLPGLNQNKEDLFSSKPTEMKTLKTNSEQGPSSHTIQDNVNSAYYEFQDLFRNPGDLLRQSRGSLVPYTSSRIMRNKEMLGQARSHLQAKSETLLLQGQ